MAGLLWLAILACLFPTAALAQTVNQYTNSTTGSINAFTSCTTPLVRNFTVGTSFTVADVDLGLFMSHAWRGDIRVTLQSPAGTRVQVINGNTNNAADNLNVILSDENTGQVGGSGHVADDQLTPAPPPYQRALVSNNALSAFDGQNSAGTWRLEICDTFPSADNGTFTRADLYLTQPPASYADLSLTKTVSNATPASGNAIAYTLSVTNSASSPSAASGVTVLDQLPVGVSFVSATGTGSYDSTSGVWTVGSIPAGTTRTLTINVTVTAGLGTTIQNDAEILASSIVDLDSVPNNGSTLEDDDASVSFTTTGTRTAGTPPTLVCPNGTTLLDWNAQSWTSGSSTGTATVANIGTIGFNVTTQGTFTVPLELNATITGGTVGQNSLYQNVEYTTRTQTTTTVVTLPTAVPGTQFTIFDVDYAANDFADKMTITGSYNGASVTPTLTNGVTNYVFGNVAIGDVTATDTTNQGTVIATFSSPVDTITIVYGNHTTAPADPDGQAIAINDFTFCNPQTTLSVTKLSSVVSDGVSGTNPKSVPGAIVRYCVLVSNSGSATSSNVVATDSIPANLTFIPGSMFSGTSCAAATTAEDDNNSGGDETDPYGMDFAANVVTGRAASLGPAASFAMVFNATVN
ncbi:MAG: proprotein convertase, P [Sphingopyxis sp.]|nr:proprotein convertase, P [Sphingopyxis sp.]